MPLIDKRTLVSQLAPPFDTFLATQLVDEYVSLERRYVLRDWGPSELDGAHFCEVLARLIYHQDSNHLNLKKDFDDCSKYIDNDQVSHAVLRSDAKMLFMVMTVVHKFRSKRGVAHVSPTYEANHMDAKYMMEAARWAMVETLRIFWTGDREAAARAVQELLRFEVPCVGKFEDVLLVQRTDLHPEDEILVLLHYAGVQGFSRRELGTHAVCSAVAVTRAIEKLTAPNCRQIVEVDSKRYVITDLGNKEIRERLAARLLIE